MRAACAYAARRVGEFAIRTLLATPTVAVRDVACRGSCGARGAEEATGGLHLVFPYRGVYVRHTGRDAAVADANQVLFFNPAQGYRVSHPVRGGDACLDLVVAGEHLRELAPRGLVRGGATLALHRDRLPLDPRAQAMVARLRLHAGALEPLEAESRALALVGRALGAPLRAASPRQRLVDRVKLVLASDLSRRWTLGALAAEVGASAIYLTQVFQQVEGVPLYRYQLRLRLARGLALLDGRAELAQVALELGFSSHSHFTAAFRRVYGHPPSALRRA